MKLKRHGIMAGIALTAATLALAGCGSDNTTPSSGSSSAGSSTDCASGSLTAQGSTAQKNAMDEWIKAYQQKCSGAQINYQGTGSGAGVTAFNGKSADFAGSDSALKDGDETTKATARCGGSPALNLPMVVGPIAVAYNLDGVKDLTLKPATLAQIFSGKITKWDDAAIKADNPSAQLPSIGDLLGPPLGRLGYDRQLHQLPQGRGRGRLDLRPQQDVEGAGRAGGQGFGRCREHSQVDAGHDRLRRALLRREQLAVHGEDRERRR